MDEFEGAEFIDLSARRAPKLDKYYKGVTEMDWYDNEDRIAMVREAGFHCDMSECGIDDCFCRTCVANEWCSEYQDILEEEERCQSVNHAEPR